MEQAIFPILTQFGGLGVLALFAWALLKSMLKQQEKLGNLFSNHLTKLLERQETNNKILADLLEQQRNFSQAWQRHMEHFEKLEDRLPKPS